MESTTPLTLGPQFASDLIAYFVDQVQYWTGYWAREFWNIGWQLVRDNLLIVAGFLLFLLIISAIKAFSTGRWGMFASVLYNYFYGTVMIAIGFIFGPETFGNDYFKIIAFLVYVFCFWLVGQVLKKTGLRRRF